jgi:hypothetical protein
VIVFLYRWKIKTGKENQFEDNWTIVTNAIREECGSYGSRLHLGENNEYVGYAQWPDFETREKCELLDSSSVEARRLMREAVEHSYPGV